MQRTKIDWPGLDYTWNPVIGCKGNCSYCYAKRMNTRFRWIPDWNKPQYFPNRLEIPLKVKKPSTWFVGSISDICYWEHNWILETLEIVNKCPHHTFMFLTKNPLAYYGFKWPENTMQGLTITGTQTCHCQCEMLDEMLRCQRPYLSIEPLMGEIKDKLSYRFEIVIVGADTSPGAKPPEKEWIDSIKHPNIHYKENILKHIRRLK